MNIVLANPPWYIDKHTYGVRAGSRWPHTRKDWGPINYYPFPFFLAYATSLLKSEGHRVTLYDSVALRWTNEEFLAALQDEQPELLVMETALASSTVDFALIEEIKNSLSIPVVLAGYYPTVAPAAVLERSRADYCTIGEYEYTLRELVNALEEGRSPEDVLGLAVRNGNRTIVNDPRPLIADLDDLPFPERESLPMKRYNDFFCAEYPNVQMISSRGCPFTCTFCREPVYFGGSRYRSRSAANVADEMAYLIRRYKPREIYFDDATFTVGTKRVIGICREIQARGIRVKWSCMGHAGVMENMVKEMAAAGCRAIKFGLETTDPAILRNIRKPVGPTQVKRAVQLSRQYGISTHVTFMLGLPGETKETMDNTIEFAFSLGTDSVQFSIATPYPGTPFFKEAQEKGWLNFADVDAFDGYATSVLTYPELDEHEIQQCFKRSLMRYRFNLLKRSKTLYCHVRNAYRAGGMAGTLDMLCKRSRWALQRQR